MAFRRDEILFLLGAGASVDAGIPASGGMIGELERLLGCQDEWKRYSSLYYYLKSAIRFSEGIKGRFNNVDNIENLINTLEDLRRGDDHPLYPFIGAWNPRLTEVTKNNPLVLGELKTLILRQLRDHWIQPEDYSRAKYFQGLSRFAREYQHPLRVFTLNYDLCVEKTCADVGLELGFDEGRLWQWRNFDDDRDTECAILLLKLHGSIDWTRNALGQLTYSDSPSRIEPENLSIIFGTTYKLQYVDPFLFFAYELRKRTLSDAMLIVAVGYGFADEHINGILSQSLRADDTRRLLAVTGPGASVESCVGRIASALGLENAERIDCWNLTAKEFFESQLTIDRLESVFPTKEGPF